MENWLAISPWPGLSLWILLYISDYYLTIYSARGFREIGHFQFEGSFELTPQFQKDIEALKPVSRLHIIMLILHSLLIILIWWLTQIFFSFRWAYLFCLGMYLLIEVAVHLRHLRNVFLINEAIKNGGVEGQISYRQHFSYRISALDFYSYSGLFLIIAILTYSPFFFGGSLMCFATGLKHSLLARKTKANSLQATESQA